MNLCFEPPYPDGVSREMIDKALKYKDEAPIIAINRMVTFSSYSESVSCSCVVYNDEDIRLNSDDANFMTIRYKLIF